MSKSNQLKTEQDWRKESDARTLAEAERIKNDPARMKGAQTAAKKMIEDQQKDLQSLLKVSKTPANKGRK